MSDTAIGVPGKGTRVSGHTIQARRDPELENGERDAPQLDGRGETIDALVESFQRLAVEVPVPDLGAPFDAAWATSGTRTTRAQVRIPYWNNKYVQEVGGVSLPAPPGFDASVRGDALGALGVGQNEAVAVGKGRPDDIAGLVTRAIAAGLIHIGYAPVSDEAYWAAGWRPAIEAWLLRVGIGVDCSGFVYQALHTLLRQPGEQTTHAAGGRNGILDSYPNEDVGRTIASDELMSEQGNPVTPPDELAVADIMYITDHVRIIMAVQRSADGTEFVTAESTVDGRYRDGGAINGARIHFWRYRGAALEHRFEGSTEWLASGETPVYRRHLADA